MGHKLALVAVAALFPATLTACGGGDDTAAYCDTLKETQSTFDDLGTGPAGFGGLDELLDTVHDVTDDAPDDIKGDWEVVDKALTDAEQGLEDAGLSLEDLGDISSPTDLEPDQLATLGQAIAPLQGQEFTTALGNIQKHAEDECDITIS